MSTAAAAEGALWSEVLPPNREFIALPPGGDPVVIAEKDRGVITYVRRSLLAAPPRTGLPPVVERAALAGASQVLRVPSLWPLLKVSELARRDWAGDSGIASWLSTGGRRVLVLHHSRDTSAGVVMLLFDAGATQPSVALKIADNEAGAARLRREKDRLRLIRGMPLGPVLASIPSLLPARESRFSILATRAQPGAPMLVSYHRPGHTRNPHAVGADFNAAATWLAGLQSHATGGPEPLSVPEVFKTAALEMLGGTGSRVEQILDALTRLRARISRYVALQTVVHGDFWPGNTLTDGRRVTGVVDWELAKASGSPVRDLARFAVAYSLYLDRHTPSGRAVRGHLGLTAGPPGAGVLHAANGTGWYPAIIRSYLREGLARVGVPESAGRDAMQVEVAANAAEATDPEFARSQWALFLALERTRP